MRRANVVLVFVGLLFGALVAESTVAEAVHVSSNPGRPVISQISVSAGASRGKVNIRVSFTAASTPGTAPVLATEVRVGTATCTAIGKAASCLVRNLVSGKKYKVLARARNRYGYGTLSTAVSVTATSGVTWRRGDSSDSTTTSVPAEGSPSTSSPPGSVSTTSLKFNLRTAVGLTLKSSISSASVRIMSTGSNLQAVDSSGTTTDAVSSGTATISKFLIAPNNKLYVVFSTKTTIGATSCLLAEVDKTSGNPACIDSELASITWSDQASKTNPYVFEPIQFDDSGAIYYLGKDSTGKSALRRYKDGSGTSLVTDNVNSLRFLVMSDGRVILGGTTTSSGANWTRLVTTAGGLQSLVSGVLPEFLSRFPDGNVYMGMWGGDSFGVKRFFSATSSMDSTYWIAGNMNGRQNAYYNVAEFEGTPQYIDGLRSYYGAKIRQVVSTSDGKVFAITGTTPTLVQYYPSVSKPATVVSTVGLIQRVLSYIILSGTNSTGQNITTLYNTSTNQEQTLIPSSNEIEIYHLNYVASTNKVMFDGLRFSDNKYVLGQVDLNTGQMTSSQTGSSKLVDFQTFGS